MPSIIGLAVIAAGLFCLRFALSGKIFNLQPLQTVNPPTKVGS